MAKPCAEICICPLKGVIDIIAKKWALLIINTIGNRKTARFKHLMTDLSGISPKTLSDTLRRLVETGLLHRQYFAEIPPRVEYTLANDGRTLRHAIIPLLQWAATRDQASGHDCTPDCSKSTSHHVNP